MTLREQFYAELYRDYLSLTESQLAALTPSAPFDLTAQAVLPELVDVPRLCPHDDALATLPCLAVVATEGKTKHPYLMTVDVFARLQIQTHVQDGDEDAVRSGTPLLTAQAWLQAFTEVLHATETFRAYLLTLSTDQRRGGQILMRMADSGIVHVHEAADFTHTWELKITHRVDVSPLT